MMAEITGAVSAVAPIAAIASAQTISDGSPGKKLDEPLTTILEILSTGVDDRGATIDMISYRFVVSSSKAQHYMEVLEDKNLVYSTYAMGAQPRWHLDKEGRAYLAKWDRL